MRQFVAITAGDVAGIGPEVIVRAVCDHDIRHSCVPVLIGHPEIFRRAARLTGYHLMIEELSTVTQGAEPFRTAVSSLTDTGIIACWNPAGDHSLEAPIREVSALSGDAAFQYLISAIQLTKAGCVDAIATAPLNKEALHLAGHNYPGHTEILAESCGVTEFAMMLHLPESALAAWRSMIQPLGSSNSGVARHGLSIAHVTLHTSIASVPALLTENAIAEKIRLMSDFLKQIRCERGAIAVCALNPHGGENGLFGNEEQEVIAPAVERCRPMLPNLAGPLPVDTLIRRAISGEFDGVVAMYHDQGHIPVKLIGFDTAVNITLGLPMIRTSPTHGTAFDRAWNPSTPADARGMKESIRMAIILAGASNDVEIR
jgi:4-hydroxythreonine-4-phosphate dehydrogenase